MGGLLWETIGRTHRIGVCGAGLPAGWTSRRAYGPEPDGSGSERDQWRKTRASWSVKPGSRSLRSESS